MPKIAVYKGNNSIIPVAAARKATAYMCPFTKTIVNTKKKYIAHLKQLRESRMHTHARTARLSEKFSELRHQPSFDAVIAWINSHPEVMFDNALLYDGSARDSDFSAQMRAAYSIKILHLSLVWKPNLSNSHSAPIGKAQNFSYNANKPTGYPGWEGRITFESSNLRSFYSGLFSRTGINTGSGGGGGNSMLSYDVKFFDDDWPVITRSREKEVIMNSLSSNNTSSKYSYDIR